MQEKSILKVKRLTEKGPLMYSTLVKYFSVTDADVYFILNMILVVFRFRSRI